MFEDSQNGLCAKTLQRQRILSAWTPGLLTLRIQRSVSPYLCPLHQIGSLIRNQHDKLIIKLTTLFLLYIAVKQFVVLTALWLPW